VRGITKLLLLLGAGWVLLAGGPAAALDPRLDIGQYKHTVWTADDGAPAVILALAQGRDGYLWVGARDGLFRFDGVSFELITPVLRVFRRKGVSALLVARDGAVWVGYSSGGLTVFRDNVLREVPLAQPLGYVISLVQARDGGIWMLRGPDIPPARFYGGQWEDYGPDRGLPAGQVFSLIAARNGDVWATSRTAVYVLRAGARNFTPAGVAVTGHGALSQAPDGRIWLSDLTGSRPITDAAPGAAAPRPIPTPGFLRSTRTFFDRDGALWGKTGRTGIFRLRSPGATPAAAAPVDVYQARDGLQSDAASAIIEDREGSIWVGSPLGLERFRAAGVVAEPALTRFSTWGFVLLGASDGSVYVGQLDSVYRIRPGGRPEPVLEHVTEVGSICEGPDKSIWIVLADRIVRIRKDGARTTLARPPLGVDVQDCAVAPDGALWVTALLNGMFRYADGRWTNLMIPPPGDAGPFPTTLRAGPDGRLLLYSQVDELDRIDGTARTPIAPRPRPSVDDLNTLYPRRIDLLIAGAFGVGRVRDGRLSFIPPERVPAFDDPTGLVQTPEGETWLVGRAGIVELPSLGLERAFDEPNLKLTPRIFDIRDGVPGLYNSDGHRDVVRGGDGRLWFSTTAGVVWIDPARIPHNPSPPRVSISALKAAGREWRDPTHITLPAGASSGEIDYTALSLAIPERVKFRYRLEGAGTGWVDPGRRRQMFFTNLGPGTYRFHVIAANEDGVWNHQGATLAFTIPPTFLQSIWFKLILALLFSGLIWFAYSLRLRELTGRVRADLEARLSERERIARELHDTLLQGFQGLVLRFQAVAERIPRKQPLRKAIDEALDRADAVLIEGRDRVRELRHTPPAGDLTQALVEAAAQLSIDHPARFDLTVEGRPRELHPMVRDEVQRIGEEAIRNAFQHARASSIEVIVTYRSGQLSLNVRDDGVGLPGEVAAAGARDGHFGLTGMRERAERVGGTIRLASRAGAGTEVRLSIPGSSAYAARPGGGRYFLRRLRRWLNPRD